MMKSLIAAAALAACGLALAKIPAPVLDDAAKAKAAEAAAKTAWQAKVDSFQLCRAQDRAVMAYKKGGKPADAKAQPVAAKPAAAAASAPMPAGVAACADPGPFAYAPPEQKPLEASGAHSPAPTAASPPSVKTPAADMAPAKPGAAPAKKS
jgi:hypothetical protein